MIGQLTYNEIEIILNELETSSNNIKQILDNLKDNPDLSNRCEKIYHFLNEIDNYVRNTKNTIKLNQDADLIIERIKNNI